MTAIMIIIIIIIQRGLEHAIDFRAQYHRAGASNTGELGYFLLSVQLVLLIVTNETMFWQFTVKSREGFEAKSFLIFF